ncbi:MAG TPA: ABC-F family ATP-binding cassette domain-containing protein [Miltoncostaeaceae bacterium]|nr:ABC-F family ATP-binding cassette domain-containing protein [Miltoncostaeaceae bacterium]
MFGARDLLRDVSFRVDPGDRVAVVGRNGEGKTTLLRILAGQLEADGGSISLPKGATIALHDQRPPRERGLTLGEYVAQGMREAEAAEAELAELEGRMAAGDAGVDVLDAYERAQARLERAGGYAWRSWIERVLRGLGIPESWLERPLDGFSGGELTRASLARSLVSRPDVLLLDEPTNHLDLEAVEWLERAIADLGAAVVLVSHDRYFLESVATSVVEIDRGRAKWWPMGYSAFRRERALALDRQGAEAERQAAEIARLERFVTRWRAGTKARQASSRQKQIDRLQRVRVDAPRRQSHMAFGFPKAEATGRVVLGVDGLCVEVPGRRLVSELGFTLERGWRLGIVGPNGAGKTTLLETLIGRRVPAAGRVSIGHRVQAAYFSQHGEELDERRTVVETVLADSDLTSTQARTLLGGFLFSGEAADRPVERLSGGERRRLSLVSLIARGGNLLVLDEPTNHLDTESCEALETALDAYDGTVLIISHDRALLDAVCTHTLALEDGHGVLRPGGYADLIGAREAEGVSGPAAQLSTATGSVSRAVTGASPGARGARRADGAAREGEAAERGRRPARRPPQRLQREVEERIAAVERTLADPATLADHRVLAEEAERHRVLQEELAWLMLRWEEASEALQTA